MTALKASLLVVTIEAVLIVSVALTAATRIGLVVW